MSLNRSLLPQCLSGSLASNLEQFEVIKPHGPLDVYPTQSNEERTSAFGWGEEQGGFPPPFTRWHEGIVC
jgi:hypothetical protein